MIPDRGTKDRAVEVTHIDSMKYSPLTLDLSPWVHVHLNGTCMKNEGVGRCMPTETLDAMAEHNAEAYNGLLRKTSVGLRLGT